MGSLLVRSYNCSVKPKISDYIYTVQCNKNANLGLDFGPELQVWNGLMSAFTSASVWDVLKQANVSSLALFIWTTAKQLSEDRHEEVVSSQFYSSPREVAVRTQLTQQPEQTVLICAAWQQKVVCQYRHYSLVRLCTAIFARRCRTECSSPLFLIGSLTIITISLFSRVVSNIWETCPNAYETFLLLAAPS